MPSQKKRKIKIVTIHDSFFKLVKDTEPELLQIRKEMQRRPCLVLLKIKYKGKKLHICITYAFQYIKINTQKYIFFFTEPQIYKSISYRSKISHFI